MITDEHQVVAGVLAPRLEEVVEPTEAEETSGEPEVIKKGKDEE
jgi:hypothetical protein